MLISDKNNTNKHGNILEAWWIRLVLMTVLSALLVAASWPVILDVTLEVGDFAANSLLIQDAKSLQLFTGHYSRLGFHHPGPAILYVLAAGELLFHDVLHIVDYPISGQVIAAAVYNACWLFAIFSMLVRMLGSNTSALLGTASFAFAAALFEPSVLNGLWPPHLFLFPFATMLLAASRVSSGHTDSWLALAVSSGFLINGHISFVAIIGIIFLVIAARFAVQQIRSPATPRSSYNAFLATHGKQAILFLVVVSLFLVPLLIETVLRFPGPVAKYLTFSGGNEPNSIGEAIVFTAHYWGTVFPMSLCLALLGVLVVMALVRRDSLGRELRSLTITLLAATLAMGFYARYGVDYLDMTYVGIFYYAVPALTIATAIACLFQRFNNIGMSAIALVLASLFIAGTLAQARHPAPYMGMYDQPEVEELYRSLDSLNHDGRLVLELNSGANWAEIWSNSAALLAYARRQNNDSICINNNWHISFTHASKCTPEDVHQGRRLLVLHASDDARVTEGRLGGGSELSLYPFTPLDLVGKGYISISAQPLLFSGQLLKGGWSPVGQEFVWSQDNKAQLVVSVSPDFNGSLTLDLDAFLPTPTAQQNVQIAINEQLQQPLLFDANNSRQQVAFPAEASDNNLITIDFHIETPLSPWDFGSTDKRKLGVALYGLQVEQY